MTVEGFGRGVAQGLGAIGALGPDQAGAIVRQRKNGEGPAGQEIFVGHALVRMLHADGGHHSALAIAPADVADAGGLAQYAVAALGADHQRRGQRPSVRERQGRAGRGDVQGLGGGRGQHLNTLVDHRLGQGGADLAVLDQIAQRLALGTVGDFAAVEAQKERRGAARGRARRLAVGDQDLLDPLGVGRQGLAGPDRPPLAERRIGDGRGTPVKALGQLGVERLGVDQQGLDPGRGQGERQGGSGHAGSGDDDVGVVVAHGRIWRAAGGGV